MSKKPTTRFGFNGESINLILLLMTHEVLIAWRFCTLGIVISVGNISSGLAGCRNVGYIIINQHLSHSMKIIKVDVYISTKCRSHSFPPCDQVPGRRCSTVLLLFHSSRSVLLHPSSPPTSHLLSWSALLPARLHSGVQQCYRCCRPEQSVFGPECSTPGGSAHPDRHGGGQQHAARQQAT